jgi:hypothetical protein
MLICSLERSWSCSCSWMVIILLVSHNHLIINAAATAAVVTTSSSVVRNDATMTVSFSVSGQTNDDWIGILTLSISSFSFVNHICVLCKAYFRFDHHLMMVISYGKCQPKGHLKELTSCLFLIPKVFHPIPRHTMVPSVPFTFVVIC